MKLHSCLRKSAGAALGMVAASLFIIFAIGLFFYYAGSLLGGGHELNRASDSGILSVAKQALVQPAVALNDPQLLATNSCIVGNNLQVCPENPVPYSDFSVGMPGQTNSIADQSINGVPAIDLITYNKCAAQAVLVGLRAEQIGTQYARQHAQAVAWAVVGIGKVLQQRFAQGGLDGYFDNAANLNTLDMLGRGSNVSRTGNLSQAYIAAGPSNIYFYSDVVNEFDPNALAEVPQSTDPADPKPSQAAAQAGDAYFPAGEVVRYVQGYIPIVVMPGTAEASLITFVPDNPQSTPHLIDKTRIAAAATPPDGNILAWAPPNAFQANSKANVDITGSGRRPDGTFINAISCAMIGCGEPLPGFPGLPGGGGGPQDQPARIPGGYLRVYNLAGMESVTTAPPLGPVPGGNSAGEGYDASGFILNNAALDGALGKNIYFGTPLPENPPGTVIINKVVFSENAAGKAELAKWINFNKSRITDPNDPLYNLDVVNGEHRDRRLDPFTGPHSAHYLNASQNPTDHLLYEGPTLSGKAHLNQLINLTGVLDIDNLSLDGVTGKADSNGVNFSANILMNITVNVAGANLGQGPPKQLNLNVPFNHRTWSWVEYVKDKVIHNFGQYFDAGHYKINANKNALLTGVKYFKWWHNNGNRVHWSSPNNYLLQTTGSSHGLEQPSSSQFMTVGTPYNLFNMIDDQIQHKGGYTAGQVSYEAMRGSVLNQLRLINPKWTEADLDNALNSAELAPGTLMYLRDDGTGRLIMTNTCPQDTGTPPEGYVGITNPNVNQQVAFFTQPGQDIQLMGNVIDTALDGSLTAYKADCNVEQQPWRTVVGNIQYEAGAILYKATGYNNLVGQVNFFSQPAQNVNVSFAHPN